MDASLRLIDCYNAAHMHTGVQMVMNDNIKY